MYVTGFYRCTYVLLCAYVLTWISWNLVRHCHIRLQELLWHTAQWVAVVKLKLKMNLPADIAITPCQDIEVPGYLPGFRSQHWTAILTATMLCYTLPVTVTNQKFIGISTLLHSSASGFVSVTLLVDTLVQSCTIGNYSTW